MTDTKDKLIKIVEDRINATVAENSEGLARDYEIRVSRILETGEDIKRQVKEVVNLPFPADGLDFFVNQNGLIWVSELTAFPGQTYLQISAHGFPIQGMPHEYLPQGVYKFVLIAIPQKVQPNRDGKYFMDGCGRCIHLG